jgi:OCT family organic cation transporter-like MFS transporter 4/5
MNYDDLLALLGNFSAYQLRNYILLCIPIILCAFQKLSNVFILGNLNHRCRLAPNETDANFWLTPEVLNKSFPFDNGKFSNCSFYTDHFYAPNGTVHEEQKCPGDYIWDRSKFQSSAIQEFELVCDQDYYKAISNSLFMIGVFIGSFAFGHASDIYGRRKVFVISLISQLIFGILTAFATNIYMLTIFRMVSFN